MKNYDESVEMNHNEIWSFIADPPYRILSFIADPPYRILINRGSGLAKLIWY